MAKRLLADVLWEAANTHLNHEPHEARYMEGVHMWSCWAIDRALRGRPTCWDELKGEPWTFLFELGLNASPHDGTRLKDQGARYMWLLLAMHVAEDEGITL